jgi:hypothetical protein
MSEDEIDRLLAEKLKSCVSQRNLPDGFTARLTRSVVRSRRMFYRRVVILAILLATLLTGIVGFWPTSVKRPPCEATLIAAREPEDGEEVSGWMLLGAFRECFKRNKSNKRKEEN